MEYGICKQERKDVNLDLIFLIATPVQEDLSIFGFCGKKIIFESNFNIVQAQYQARPNQGQSIVMHALYSR